MDFLISSKPVNKMAAVVNKVSQAPVLNLSEKEYKERLDFVAKKQRYEIGKIEINVYFNQQFGVPFIEIPTLGGADQFFIKVGSAKAKNIRVTKSNKLHMT